MESTNIHNRHGVKAAIYHKLINVKTDEVLDESSIMLENSSKISAVYWLKKSRNDEINIEIIETTPDAQWNWFVMSKNSHLTNEILIKYIDEEWDWCYLIGNFPFNMEFLNFREPNHHFWKKFSENDDFWKKYSKNHHLTCEIVEAFRDKKWNWNIIAKRFPFSVEFLENQPETNVSFWQTFSENDYLTCEIVEKFLNKPWNWSWLSIKIPWVNIMTHLHWPWIWESISSNKTINAEALSLFPDAPWNYGKLASNENIPIEFFIKKKWFSRVEETIYKRKNFQPEMILEHPELKISWFILSSRMPSEYIMEHLYFPWESDRFQQNQFLTNGKHDYSKYELLMKSLPSPKIAAIWRFFNKNLTLFP
ncbi:MAG: hypothetical protein KAS12_02825 [Candidatus Aenigmarchaeota archaeon]|nr:hypothetical protein [Candidatus Aenigmarchaeota archaeon]